MVRCAILAAVAAGLFGQTPAAAADLPGGPQRGPVVAPAFNWSGFYAGVMGGYVFGAGDNSGVSGGIGGGTIGWNYQPAGSGIVFGLEADGGWTNAGRSQTASAGGVTVTAETKASAIVTVRGRLGAAFDRTLIYATAGGAWARNTISVTASSGSFSAGLSDTQFHTGYTAGAGVEQAFAGNWSAKLEYLYFGFGSKDYFGQFGGLPSGDVDVHSVRVGLNYRFGG